MLRSRLQALAAALAVLVVAVAVGAGSARSAVDTARLPLGDGKVTAKPADGKVLSCQKAFLSATGSGTTDGPWIHPDGTWDSTAKAAVAGSVAFPKAAYSTRVRSGKRLVVSNDLPRAHRSGTFPIAKADPVHQYDANPNRIVAKSVSLSLPEKPARGTSPTCVGSGPIGVLTDGVLLFGPLDSYGRDAVAHEILDRCGGHPDGQGVYHRHNVAPCVAAAAKGKATLVGYALDGFGIYVERDAAGKLVTDDVLDQCHGRRSRVPWDGKNVRIYHYVATAEYPYTLGCFRGKPARSGLPPVGGPGTGGVQYAPR
jgi:hypothetical protein